MSKSIFSIGLVPLQNGEHRQFHYVIIQLLNGHLILMASYQLGFNVQEDAMQKERSSAVTRKITEANAYRGQLDRCFTLLVESATMSHDPAMRRAGENVMHVLLKYGDLRKLAYNNQSSEMSIRNKEINDNYAADVEVLGGTIPFSKLDEANINFISNYGDRNNEIAARAGNNVLTARTALDPMYDAIVAQINALTLVEGEENYAEIIDRINVHITYYKNILANRRGRNKAGEPTEPTDVPEPTDTPAV